MAFRTHLAALGFALSAPAFAATCWSPNHDLGALPDGETVYFGSSCFGTGATGDPERHYDEYFTLTLDADVPWLWGHAEMPQVRDLDPDSPTRGDFLYAMTVDTVTLEFEGVVQIIGTDIHMHEVANFYAADLLAGDYVLGFHGSTFGHSGAGSFNAFMGVYYAPAVPEPDASWLLLAGLAALAPILRARPRRG